MTAGTAKKEAHKEQASHLYHETFTITFYSLSLPWNKNFGNSQEAQNAIVPTSRTINNADSAC